MTATDDTVRALLDGLRNTNELTVGELEKIKRIMLRALEMRYERDKARCKADPRPRSIPGGRKEYVRKRRNLILAALAEGPATSKEISERVGPTTTWHKEYHVFEYPKDCKTFCNGHYVPWTGQLYTFLNGDLTALRKTGRVVSVGLDGDKCNMYFLQK